MGESGPPNPPVVAPLTVSCDTSPGKSVAKSRATPMLPTFDSDEDGGVVLAVPLVGPRHARVVGAVRLLDAVDDQPRPGRSAVQRRQRHARVRVGRQQLVAAVPRHVRRPPAPRATVEVQRPAGDDAVRPVETAHVRVRCRRHANIAVSPSVTRALQMTTITRTWANAQRDGRPAEYRWRLCESSVIPLLYTTPQTFTDAHCSSAVQ